MQLRQEVFCLNNEVYLLITGILILATSSRTGSFLIGLLAMELKPGDEVMAPEYVCRGRFVL